MFQLSPLRKATGLLALAVATLLHSCGIDHRTAPDPTTLPNRPIYLLTNNNQLVETNVNNLGSLTYRNITGVTAGERIVGIDFRPATGQLYGYSQAGGLFVINPATGAARLIGSIAQPPGETLGFDFNPTVDLIRLVTPSNRNQRIDPTTGALAGTDTPLTSPSTPTVTPQIGAVAYTNNTAGATTTLLYDVDPVTDQLFGQNPANGGVLTPVGSLGIDISAVGGFDIAPSGEGLMTITYQGQDELSSVNLATGFLQKLGNLPGGIIGLAIPTNPVAYALDGNNGDLLIFNPTVDNQTPIRKPIVGLDARPNGLDFRPLNGVLYAITRGGLYTINPATGVPTQVGTTGTGRNETSFDFNPVADLIRVMPADGSVGSLNFVFNPQTGERTQQTGSPFNFVQGAAYSNNFAGATQTTLYTVDLSGNALKIQNPPSDATQQQVVGPLGISPGIFNGFDIGGQSGRAYLLTGNTLYEVNLATGAATRRIALTGITDVNGFTLGLGF